MRHRARNGHIAPKSGHGPLMESLRAFVPDSFRAPIVSLSVGIQLETESVPMHRHKRGQLTLTGRGSVICEIESGIWLIPPDTALWIPGGLPHRTTADADSSITYLYIKPSTIEMSDTPGTLRLTPLVRELIRHISALPNDYQADSPQGRIAAVLLEQLSLLPIEKVAVSMPRDERLRQIALEMAKNPGDTDTINQWASKLALSEKTLRRLVSRETGMTFGHWRHQLYLMIAIRELSKGHSVDAVASQLGYKSTSAFTLMFKRSLGKAPKAYMRERDARRLNKGHSI